MVCDHRPAGLGQDDRAGQFRAAFPAGGAIGRRCGAGRGWYAQLRLVVYRPGRIARHRWPLYHPGQQLHGGQSRLAGLSRLAEKAACAPAYRRCLYRHQPLGSAAGHRRRARSPCRRDSPAHPGAVYAAGRAFPHLPDAHQARPGAGLHGVLRQPEQGRARPGVGHDLCPGRRQKQRQPAGAPAKRIRRPGAAPQRTPGRALATGTRPGTTRPDLRLPAAVRRVERLPAKLPRRRVQTQRL